LWFSALPGDFAGRLGRVLPVDHENRLDEAPEVFAARQPGGFLVCGGVLPVDGPVMSQASAGHSPLPSRQMGAVFPETNNSSETGFLARAGLDAGSRKRTRRCQQRHLAESKHHLGARP